MRRREVLAAGLAIGLAPDVLAQPAPVARPGVEREAALLPGKRVLRQRVLTRPGAAPRPEIGGQPAGAALTALTALYVYGHNTAADGTKWLEVGRAIRGATLGWLKETEVVEWQHTMTAILTNPAGRERTLFFRDRDSLTGLLGGGHIAEELRGLASSAQRPPVPADFPVVAMAPIEHIDIRQKFYLLPILQAESLVLQRGTPHKVLEVASVPLSAASDPPKEFTLGVVFLVDTTLSMDPYIERVRVALNRMTAELLADREQRIRVAVVGFRNSLQAQPRLEYLTRTFATFADSADPPGFAGKIAAVRATSADSLSFNEDSFAAIKAAIEGTVEGGPIDWTGIGGKLLVLVTDAGSRGATDRYSATREDALGMHKFLADRQAGLLVLHLKTPQGIANHAYAETQYRRVSEFAALGPHYYPVERGDEASFERQERDLLAALRRIARAQRDTTPPPAGQPDDIGRRAELLGYALRLAWLGRQNQNTAPDLLRAWVADTYSDTMPQAMNIEVALLLTRNQLNDLSESVRLIVEQGRLNMIDSDRVFERLQSVAAAAGRLPAEIQRRGLETLGDLLNEYLDGLPYQSEIATYDRDSWRDLGEGRQAALLDQLDARLRSYRTINQSATLWTNLDGSNDPNEAVYPLPLNLLP